MRGRTGRGVKVAIERRFNCSPHLDAMLFIVGLLPLVLRDSIFPFKQIF